MHEGHRKRMRERYQQEGGFDHFAQHEVLEMLLYSTIPRGDTNPIAHDLIREFGNIANVFEADPQQLMQVPGVGEKSAFLLNMIPHLSRIYQKTKWDRWVTLGTTELAGEYAVDMFIGKQQEEFCIICLDSNRRVFYQGVVTRGTINEVPAYPRLVISEVLKHNTQNVILTHNHPNGMLQPSEGDKIATKQLVLALEAINVNVIDHIIVAGNRYFSMAAMDLL